MKWGFIGPTPLSGIGQVMLKYSKLVNGSYVEFDKAFTLSEVDKILIFIFGGVSIELALSVKRYYRDSTFYVMTVCETYPVNAGYGEIFKNFENVLTPSEFCAEIFKSQFEASVTVVPHWHEPLTKLPLAPSNPYVFYTIGNVMDPRKNIGMLVDAFKKCNFEPGTAKLLLKATCKTEVVLRVPDVEVVNGLITNEQLETQIHGRGHCYINCSHSEGVGMGAVEAALHNKPIIIGDFGGLKEYINTPYVLHCKYTHVGSNAEFLFAPDMVWGQPDIDELIKYMKICYDERYTIHEHPETRAKMEEAAKFFSHA
jgi:glycosyltransferase involved in cell wall biosynthesis